MQYNPCNIPLPPLPALSSSSNKSSELDQFSHIMSTTVELTENGSSIKTLESHNYHHWNDLILSYFLEHNLDGIVDGTKLQPTSSTAESQNWLLRQKKAAGFIARKLDLVTATSSSTKSLVETSKRCGRPLNSSTPQRRLGTDVVCLRGSHLLVVLMVISSDTLLCSERSLARCLMQESILMTICWPIWPFITSQATIIPPAKWSSQLPSHQILLWRWTVSWARSTSWFVMVKWTNLRLRHSMSEAKPISRANLPGNDASTAPTIQKLPIRLKIAGRYILRKILDLRIVTTQLIMQLSLDKPYVLLPWMAINMESPFSTRALPNPCSGITNISQTMLPRPHPLRWLMMIP